jgi:hypothetical protein
VLYPDIAVIPDGNSNCIVVWESRDLNNKAEKIYGDKIFEDGSSYSANNGNSGGNLLHSGNLRLMQNFFCNYNK